MAKSNLKDIKKKRDGGGGAVYVMPHVVLNSAAYISLSGNAVKLLYDLAMQYNTYNNGQLIASFRYLSEERGWTSNDAITKSKKELISKELIVETVRGQRPNKASWYGLTWHALDHHKGLEITVNEWPRGAYLRWIPTEKKVKRLPPPPETREAHYAKLRNKPPEKKTQ